MVKKILACISYKKKKYDLDFFQNISKKIFNSSTENVFRLQNTAINDLVLATLSSVPTFN